MRLAATVGVLAETRIVLSLIDSTVNDHDYPIFNYRNPAGGTINPFDGSAKNGRVPGYRSVTT
jgi:hypothetical protein